jgi:hypothetical protein
MKIWIDDVRPAPEGYLWLKSVNEAKHVLTMVKSKNTVTSILRKNKPARYEVIEIIDIDHDAGDYASDGGDYIKLLDWLEETGRNYSIRIHSQNPVGVENMRRIIERNGWKEVF